MKETWKIIEEFLDYMVSDMGRVKRWKKGKSNSSKIRILKTYKNHKGYLNVYLHQNGKRATRFVHSLVLKTFIGNKDGYQCNHKKGIKSDNRLSELEWSTGSENVIHSYRTGLASNLGERHPRSILKNDDVVEIKRLIREGNMTQKEIGRLFGVSCWTISKIKHNKLWSHIKEI